jgi:ApbE superfamily uncharacterized protein (UPF0280 family)
MKTAKYQKRFYRDWVSAEGLHKLEVIVQETDLHVLTDKPVKKTFIEERVRLYRRHIEGYIQKDARFLTALKPISVELNAPGIVKEMAKAAVKANVGPMAAVAGAIAQLVGEDLLRHGCTEVIVENGGDIFLKITRPRRIAMYAGKSKLSRRLFLAIKPGNTPLGICASSGTVGHSLSFGAADSVVVISKNAFLADAVATATGNLIETARDFPRAIAFARSIKGVLGVVLMLQNNLASWGDVELA